MAPGPRPAPTQLKILRGNPRKEALNKVEPQPMMPPQVPEAPQFFNGYAREEWHRVAKELLRLRLLTIVELQPLAAYCQAYGRWRTAEEALARMAASAVTPMPRRRAPTALTCCRRAAATRAIAPAAAGVGGDGDA